MESSSVLAQSPLQRAERKASCGKGDGLWSPFARPKSQAEKVAQRWLDRRGLLPQDSSTRDAFLQPAAALPSSVSDAEGPEGQHRWGQIEKCLAEGQVRALRGKDWIRSGGGGSWDADQIRALRGKDWIRSGGGGSWDAGMSQMNRAMEKSSWRDVDESWEEGELGACGGEKWIQRGGRASWHAGMSLVSMDVSYLHTVPFERVQREACSDLQTRTYTREIFRHRHPRFGQLHSLALPTNNPLLQHKIGPRYDIQEDQ